MIRKQIIKTLEQRLIEEESALIQVLMGPRQVGKTTAILDFLNQNKKTFSEKNFHFATGDEALTHTPDWIETQWKIAKNKGPSSLLIVDEIQKVLQWSDFIKKLWDEETRLVKKKSERMKVILLGSSSLELQKGLSESLTGRFEIIPAHHWDYLESKQGFNLSLEEYLLFGGYPGSYPFLSDSSRWHRYVRDSIIETVVAKDILSQNYIKNPSLFRQSFDLLCSYPAQEISYTKLLGQLQEKGNVELVKNYIRLFEGAFLFKRLENFSLKPFKTKSSSPKILPLCPALHTLTLGKNPTLTPELKGRMFEVVVGAKLSTLDGQLFYWRERNYEVDFVYRDGNKIMGIEVKSGKEKHSKSIAVFKEKFPTAKVAILHIDDFTSFCTHPEKWMSEHAV